MGRDLFQEGYLDCCKVAAEPLSQLRSPLRVARCDRLAELQVPAQREGELFVEFHFQHLLCRGWVMKSVLRGPRST